MCLGSLRPNFSDRPTNAACGAGDDADGIFEAVSAPAAGGFCGVHHVVR